MLSLQMTFTSQLGRWQYLQRSISVAVELSWIIWFSEVVAHSHFYSSSNFIDFKLQ